MLFRAPTLGRGLHSSLLRQSPFFSPVPLLAQKPMMSRFSSLAKPSSALVTPSWLAERLSRVTVIDASWYMPSVGRNAREEFNDAHIPGASFMDIDEKGMCDKSSNLPHMLPSVDEFARAARTKLGLQDGKPAVLYTHGSSPFCASARAWWMLRSFGRDDVYVLDGGLPAWKDAGHEIEEGNTSATSNSNNNNDDGEDSLSSMKLEEKLVRTLPQILAQVDDGSGVIIDARPPDRYEGSKPEPREGLQSGHIPGSINVPSSSFVADNGTLKSPDEIRNVFKLHGLETEEIPHGPLSISCGSGVTAAIVALALNEIGVTAAVYDGSWAEYGASKDHPVVTGPLPSPSQ